MRLKVGDKAPDFEVEDIFGDKIALEGYIGKKLMLSFFRYAGCPFCNLSFDILRRHYPRYKEKGLNVVCFFQSPKEHILQRYGDTKDIPIVADPDKKIYDLYGVENSLFKGLKNLLNIPAYLEILLQKRYPQGKIDGDLLLMPAQFLIQTDLAIYKVHYGASFGDLMQVFEIEDFLL